MAGGGGLSAPGAALSAALPVATTIATAAGLEALGAEVAAPVLGPLAGIIPVGALLPAAFGGQTAPPLALEPNVELIGYAPAEQVYSHGYPLHGVLRSGAGYVVLSPQEAAALDVYSGPEIFAAGPQGVAVYVIETPPAAHALAPQQRGGLAAPSTGLSAGSVRQPNSGPPPAPGGGLLAGQPGRGALTPLTTVVPGQPAAAPVGALTPLGQQTGEQSLQSLPTRQPGEQPLQALPTRQPGEQPLQALPTRQPGEQPLQALPTRQPGERNPCDDFANLSSQQEQLRRMIDDAASKCSSYQRSVTERVVTTHQLGCPPCPPCPICTASQQAECTACAAGAQAQQQSSEQQSSAQQTAQFPVLQQSEQDESVTQCVTCASEMERQKFLLGEPSQCSPQGV